MITHWRGVCATFLSVVFICLGLECFGKEASSSTPKIQLEEAIKAMENNAYDQAFGLLQRLRLGADSLSDPDLTIAAWTAEARCRFEHPLPPDDLPDFLRQADSTAIHAADPLLQLRLFVILSRLHVVHFDAVAAKRALENARLCLRRISQPSGYDLGCLAQAEGELALFETDYPQAMKAFERCIFHLEGVAAGRRELALAYRDISMSFHRQGNSDRSIAFARQATLLHEEAFGPDHHLTAKAYSRLGNSYVVLDQNGPALDNYLRASKILRRVYGNSHPNTLKSYNGLANAYHNLGDSVRAVDYYLLALKSYWATEEDSSLGVASVYRNLGIHYFDCKNYPLARSYWERSNAVVAHREGIHSYEYLEQLTWIGESWHEQGQFEQAIYTFNRAYRLLAPEADTSFFTIPSAQMEGYKKDLRALMAMEKGVSMLSLHMRDGRIRHLKSALECLEHGISTMDSIRAGYHGNNAQLKVLEFSFQYHEMAIEAARRMYLATNDPLWLERAFGYMERSKSTMLNTALRAANLGTSQGNVADWQAHEKLMRQHIDDLDFKLHALALKDDPANRAQAKKLKMELFGAQEALQNYLSDLSSCDPSYYQLRYGAQAPRIADLRSSLGNGQSAFVEYFVGNEHYYIFVLSATQAHLIERPIQGLDQATEGFLSQFSPQKVHSKSARPDYISSAQLLYAHLIQPIANFLPKAGRILIVPDGKLGHVPFEALVRTGVSLPTNAPYASLPYLLRDYTIGYASSATSQLNAKAPVRARSDLRMMAFAPSFDAQPMIADAGRARLSELHHAPEEVKRISQYIDTDVFMGDNATENRFKQQSGDYNILHFATHGTIADDNPLWSGIAFTQGQDSSEDGMLHTMELFGMRLEADLAVLSACNTGRGKLLRGEGIMSLARGFMYAGCPSIVMSLYAVDDAASSSIMDQFYKGLAKGFDKDKALQTAKLNYLESVPDKRAHPYFWSAHVLIGAHEGFRTGGQGMGWVLVILGSVALLVLLEMRRR